jgi:hypothetical protein
LAIGSWQLAKEEGKKKRKLQITKKGALRAVEIIDNGQ